MAMLVNSLLCFLSFAKLLSDDDKKRLNKQNWTFNYRYIV